MKKQSFSFERLRALFDAKAAAMVLAVTCCLFVQQAGAQAQRPVPKPQPAAVTAPVNPGANTPMQSKVNPAFTSFSVALPNGEWGYGIKKNGQTVFVSHDRTVEGWQNVPTYTTEAKALEAAIIKSTELSAIPAKKENPTNQKQ